MKALLLNPGIDYQEGYESNRDNYIPCELLAYDRDKYVLCKKPDGAITEYKSGYLRRIDNFGYLTHRQLFSLPVTTWGKDEKYGAKPTKRKVQKELKENYKIKTEFTLYVSNNSKVEDTKSIVVGTLKEAVRVFRKYRFAQLMFNTDRWNKKGIAGRDMDNDGILYYDTNRHNNRPTYSAKVLRELGK